MSADQIMQPLNEVRGFHLNHRRLLVKKVNPFLCIPVVLQKILPYKRIPTIALVEVKALIKVGNAYVELRQVFSKKIGNRFFVFFIAGMAIVDIPTVQLKRKV